MIAWKYLDKTLASIAALRDYRNMRAIINNTSDEIKGQYESMVSPWITNLTGMPSSFNPTAGHDKLIDRIDRIDVLRHRYENALEYMTWFEPAWNSLTDNEQYILNESYAGETLRDGTRERLANELCCTERHIDRLRAKALDRLKVLLFG